MKGDGSQVKDIIKELLTRYDKKGTLKAIEAKAAWEQLMGEVIARHTEKISISKEKLIICVDSASLRQELSYSKNQIMEMMNDALGGEKITEVIVR